MRTFTLDEAQWLLPVLQGLFKQAIEGKSLMEEIDAEFLLVTHRILLLGGMLPDVHYLAGRRVLREKTIQNVKDALGEIDAIGVQVKDLDTGLLDFPCKIDGEIVLLCWKYGEDEITHWHSVEEGFRGRKPIDDAIRKGTRQASN